MARPLRWTGLILFAIHLAVWLELLNFAYSNYVGLTALVVLFAYIVEIVHLSVSANFTQDEQEKGT